MTKLSRILLALASVILLGAFVFPLWRIDLIAPQYPEGLGMLIRVNTVTGVKPNGPADPAAAISLLATAAWARATRISGLKYSASKVSSVRPHWSGGHVPSYPLCATNCASAGDCALRPA